eukprot:24289_1
MVNSVITSRSKRFWAVFTLGGAVVVGVLSYYYWTSESNEPETKQNDKQQDDADSNASTLVNSIHNEQQNIYLLDEIFSNVIKYPFDTKYHRFSINKLRKQFKNCSVGIQLLYDAGFVKSKNEKKVIFNINKMKTLKNAHKRLKKQLMHIETQNEEKETVFDKTDDNNRQKPTNEMDTYQSSNLLKTEPNELIECTLSECRHLKTLSNVLRQYHIFIQQSDDGKKELEINGALALNHFYHLLDDHSNEFDEIHNELIKSNHSKTCELSTCFILQRNYRNRALLPVNEMNLKKMYFNNDDKDIAIQQTLDKIHCHYFHPFDIKQVADEYDEDNEVSDPILTATNKLYKNINRLEMFSRDTTRFSTRKRHYSCGYTFFYWDSYKTNKTEVNPHIWTLDSTVEIVNENCNHSKCSDWYIVKKFTSFKEELLQNEICIISEQQWNMFVEKAKIHSETLKAMDFICGDYLYGIKKGDRIQKEHLMAIMIYCNNDVLSSKFSETYRKLSEKETDEELKKRHSNYYWLGRLLRECVACFRSKTTLTSNLTPKNKSYNQLYHGINQQFTIKSLTEQIKGPFSTTTDYAVALNFCSNKGMILELIHFVQYRAITTPSLTSTQGFDCQWISDFANEQEVLFIGGIFGLQITNIIDASRGINYKVYIDGLRLMTEFFDGGGKSEKECEIKPNGTVQQMAFRLLLHEIWTTQPHHSKAIEFKSCPDYIKDVLHSHCIGIKKLALFPEINNIHKYFYDSKTKLINLNLLHLIFPNMKTICYNFSGSLKSLFQSQLKFILQNQDSKLYQVMAALDRTELDSDDMHLLDKYKSLFDNVGWKLTVMDGDTAFDDEFEAKMTTMTDSSHHRLLDRNKLDGLMSSIYPFQYKNKRIVFKRNDDNKNMEIMKTLSYLEDQIMQLHKSKLETTSLLEKVIDKVIIDEVIMGILIIDKVIINMLKDMQNLSKGYFKLFAKQNVWVQSYTFDNVLFGNDKYHAFQ